MNTEDQDISLFINKHHVLIILNKITWLTNSNIIQVFYARTIASTFLTRIEIWIERSSERASILLSRTIEKGLFETLKCDQIQTTSDQICLISVCNLTTSTARLCKIEDQWSCNSYLLTLLWISNWCTTERRRRVVERIT